MKRLLSSIAVAALPYVVIRFDTQLEQKATTLETVTPMLEKDGSWRVSGYFAK